MERNCSLLLLSCYIIQTQTNSTRHPHPTPLLPSRFLLERLLVFSHLQACHLSHTAKICSLLNNNNNNDKSVIFHILRNISFASKKKSLFTNHRRQFCHGIYSYITLSLYLVDLFRFFAFLSPSPYCLSSLYRCVECISRNAFIGRKFSSVHLTGTAKWLYAERCASQLSVNILILQLFRHCWMCSAKC